MAVAVRRAAARRAVVLHGASGPGAGPDEADTLVQVELVREALAQLGYGVSVLALGLDLGPVSRLARRRIDLAFNLVEALRGDGRLIHLVPAVLESAGVPFTGAPAGAVFATSNKPLAKRLLVAAGLPTPAWAESEGGDLEPRAHYIVKSAWEDASIGLDAGSVVPGAQVPAELAKRQARFGGDWFAERFVEGREFNLSLLEGADGPEVLPVAETLFVDFPAERPRIVDYEAKWATESFAYRHTPRRFLPAGEEAPLCRRLEDLARDCWRLFRLRGYARVDFRVDETGAPWVLEVNVNPCLAPDAGFMAAAAQVGLTAAEVVGRIASAAAPAQGLQEANLRAV